MWPGYPNDAAGLGLIAAVSAESHEIRLGRSNHLNLPVGTRYGPLQGVEAAVEMALTAPLAGVGVWWIR